MRVTSMALREDDRDINKTECLAQTLSRYCYGLYTYMEFSHEMNDDRAATQIDELGAHLSDRKPWAGYGLI